MNRVILPEGTNVYLVVLDVTSVIVRALSAGRDRSTTRIYIKQSAFINNSGLNLP